MVLLEVANECFFALVKYLAFEADARGCERVIACYHNAWDLCISDLVQGLFRLRFEPILKYLETIE